MLRTVWVYAVGLVLTLYWSLRILFLSALKSPRLERTVHLAPRRWSSGILRATGVRVTYENLELLPRGQPQILVANHESWFDVFALAATLPVDYRFIGKKELSEIPLFGPAWLTAGHYAIDRSDRQAAVASLATVVERMREGGHTIVLFPEGTRSADGTMGPFKKGAFVMAINAEAPIVPVAILGSRSIMPKGRWRVRRGVVTIRVGQPIETKSYSVDQRDALTRAARERIRALKAGEPPLAPPDSEASADREPAVSSEHPVGPSPSRAL